MKREYRIFQIIVLSTQCALIAALAGCAVLGRGIEAPPPFIQYHLAMEDRELNVVRVTGRVFGSLHERTPLVVPGADDGGDLDPIGLCAADVRGRELAVEPGNGRWIVHNRGRDFTFTYDVVLTIENQYLPEIRDMLTFLAPDRCRIFCKDVFLLPELRVSDGICVDIDLIPGGSLQSQWKSTGTRMIVPALEDVSSTVAVTGDFRYIKATVGDAELCLAIAGGWPFDDGEFFDIVRSIVECELSLFGSSTHDKYLFVCDYNPVKGGKGFNYYGVHSNGSIVLLLDPKMSGAQLFDAPMAIVAHEFFHNWNGEALKPRSSDFLWFTEGATVYYSYRVLLDVRIITEEQYERQRMSIVKRFRDNPYLDSVPIHAAGNSDLGDKDMVNLLYDGGFLAAEALDGRLAELTGGRVRLIDILKILYERDIAGSEIDEEILTAAIADECGHDLTSFLDRLVHQPASQRLE